MLKTRNALIGAGLGAAIAAVAMLMGIQRSVLAQGNPTATYPPTWTPAPTLTDVPTVTRTPTGSPTPTRISPLIQTATALATLRTPAASFTPVKNGASPTPGGQPTIEATATVPVGAGLVGKIVIQLKTEVGTVLVSANADGSNRVELTKPTTNSQDINPRWSPDGKIVIFQSNRNKKAELFVVNADGSGLKRLENGEDPAWSPDGKEIAFVFERGGFKEIYAMRSDATKARRLTKAANSNDTAPSWSPDGSLIAISSTRENSKGDLWVLAAADGKNLRRLTTSLSNGPIVPIWAPDGKSIALVYQDAQNIPRLATVKPDGNDLTLLQEGNLDLKFVSRPAWSPDSQYLVYAGQTQDGQWAVYGYSVQTKQRTKVLDLTNEVGAVDWVKQ